MHPCLQETAKNATQKYMTVLSLVTNARIKTKFVYSVVILSMDPMVSSARLVASGDLKIAGANISIVLPIVHGVANYPTD